MTFGAASLRTVDAADTVSTICVSPVATLFFVHPPSEIHNMSTSATQLRSPDSAVFGRHRRGSQDGVPDEEG